MSTGLVRRAKALGLHHQLEELFVALDARATLVESLKRYELQLLCMDEKNHENIVPFPKKARPQVGAFRKIQDRRYIVQTPCLIEGQNDLERRKVALEIHLRTQRAAFLDFNDLDLQSAQDLIELADCTLFIPEIMALDSDQQIWIDEVLKTNSAPLFISATQLPFSLLRTDTRLKSGLLSSLSVAHFRLQYPLRHYLEHGFFKLFLESLC